MRRSSRHSRHFGTPLVQQLRLIWPLYWALRWEPYAGKSALTDLRGPALSNECRYCEPGSKRESAFLVHTSALAGCGDMPLIDLRSPIRARTVVCGMSPL